MKRIIAGFLVIALAVAVLPTAGNARADGTRVAGQTAVMTGRTAEPARWWGVAGAILCGLGANYIRHFGPEPGVVAATVGACALALMDVMSS